MFIADGNAWEEDTRVLLCEGCYDIYTPLYSNYLLYDDVYEESEEDPIHPDRNVETHSEDPM